MSYWPVQTAKPAHIRDRYHQKPDRPAGCANHGETERLGSKPHDRAMVPGPRGLPEGRLPNPSLVAQAVERVVGGTRRVDLDVALRDRPGTTCPVDRQCRPASARLVAEVHQQRVTVVLDPHTVLRSTGLVQTPDALIAELGDERRPSSARA